MRTLWPSPSTVRREFAHALRGRCSRPDHARAAQETRSTMANSLPILETSFAERFTEAKEVRKYFESAALYWRDIYGLQDVFAVIHQERHAAVLSLVDQLSLPRRSDVLEIGCGAGLTTVALAERGHSVK